MKNHRIKKRVLVSIAILLSILIMFVIWQNNIIVITKIEYRNNNIPQNFVGYKIVQISDLHNKEFGKDQHKLIAATKKCEPDIIVVTGDLIDCNNPNMDIAMEFINEAVKIAPVYFVSGNHEKWSGLYDDLVHSLEKASVIILDDTCVFLEKGGNKVKMFGIQDPDFKFYDDQFEERLKSIRNNSSNEFEILLSHRPEKMNTYVNQQIDLIFTGHAHGGQFRLPFIGGLISPNQGFFPKYTSNLYKKGSTSMIVNRGLGNSIIPVRLFNQPEIIVLTLHTS